MIASPRNNWMIDGVQPVDWLCPLNRGLASWWLGIPGWTGGRRLIDITSPGPNGNHGVLTGMDPATDWVPSPKGVRALDFGGGDDRVVASWPDITGADGLTIITSVNADTFGDGSNFGRIVSGETGVVTRFALNGGDDGILFVVNLTGTDANAQGTNLFTLGVDHMLAGTWKANSIHLYVDGVETNKADSDNAGTGTISSHASAALAIGNKPTVGISSFQGRIDDVRIYTRSLLRSEIEAVYRDSLQGYPQTLQRIRRTIFAAAAVEEASPVTYRLFPDATPKTVWALKP